MRYENWLMVRSLLHYAQEVQLFCSCLTLPRLPHLSYSPIVLVFGAKWHQGHEWRPQSPAGWASRDAVRVTTSSGDPLVRPPLTDDDLLADMAQVAGKYAPADAPLQASSTVVGTALEPVVAAQAVDAALDAGAPTIVPSPRPVLLPGPLLRGHFAS